MLALVVYTNEIMLHCIYIYLYSVCLNQEHMIYYSCVLFLIYSIYCDLLADGSSEEDNLQEAIQQSLEYHREETQKKVYSNVYACEN